MLNNYIKLLIIHITTIFSTIVSSQAPPRQLVFQDGENLWFGTNNGLIRYQTENELWSTVLSDSVTDVILDDAVLWAGTNQGLYYADLRYLDWKKYNDDNGLPGRYITSVTSDIDFAYAAGPNWLARLDKLIGQWEVFGDFSHTKINDLYSDQDFLWVGTDDGLFYYEKQFEKWKQFTTDDGLTSNKIYRIFYFNDFVWALTDIGLSRYTIKMKSWNSYKLNADIQGSRITYIWSDADYIWLVTPEGVFRFSSKNQVWENFSQNTQIENLSIKGLSTSGKTSWFATTDGVYSFDEEQRRWTLYTAIEGLNDDEQDAVFCVGPVAITKRASMFNVYQASDDLWRSYEIPLSKSGDTKMSQSQVFNDEKGLGFSTSGGQSASLLGRTYFKLKNRAEFSDPLWKNISDYIFSKDLDSVEYAKFKDYLYWWPKAQLNLIVDLHEGRGIRGTFDNTDPLDSLRYSLEYRGDGDDHVRRAGWLRDHKTDYFFSTLIDPTYFEGAGVRTEFGSRVGEKKLRRVNTGVWAGWRKSKYMRKLIPFQEDNFYLLKVSNIITESVELRIDGKILDPREYSIERTKGSLIFKNDAVINPDSRIEISFEHLPIDTIPGEYVNDMVSVENVVAFNEKLSLGTNGLYHGFDEYNKEGSDFVKNRLFVGNVNGVLELKSSDEKISFKAIPEISSSYHDSIVALKQGTAAKLNASAVVHNLRLKGLTQFYTSHYETIADVSSVYGRMNHHGEIQATFDITSYMPLSAGFSLVDAKQGNENSSFFEYLIAPAGKPSIKLYGLYQKRERKKNRLQNVEDSLVVNRINGLIESEWDAPEHVLNTLRLNRFWINASYAVNHVQTDSTVIASDEDTTSSSLISGPQTKSIEPLQDTVWDMDSHDRLNHNFFGKVQLSPHKNITLETKQIFRYFQYLPNEQTIWEKKGIRYRPEYTLFSQEFIPGVTLYSKFRTETTTDIFGPDTNDTTGTLSYKKVNTSVLLIPGVWWSPLDPLQLNVSFNLDFDTYSKAFDSIADFSTTYARHEESKRKSLTLTDKKTQSYSMNPLLDFGQNIHFVNRTTYSQQKIFDSLLVGNELKMTNELEWFFRDRKTKLLSEYGFLNKKDFHLSDTIVDTLSKDTVTLIRSLNNLNHEFLAQWTERWTPFFRTELPVKLGWSKNDSTLSDIINDTSETKYEVFSDYRYAINPGFLIDWRIEKTFIREFRVQYYIGLSLNNGDFLNLNSYEKTWQNKLDVGLKAGRNFFLRLLLNINYQFDDRILKYDLAEFKATALF